MARFDVAIVPFMADAMVKSMNPIKLDAIAAANAPPS